MYDANALQSINAEQLVTATDRLLLRGGRVARRRPALPVLPTLPPSNAYAHLDRATLARAAFARTTAYAH